MKVISKFSEWFRLGNKTLESCKSDEVACSILQF